MKGERKVKYFRIIAALSLVVATAPVFAQKPDPRTAEGQLTVCGGAASWQSIGYLDFSVSINTPTGKEGPWNYRWDRRNNFLRMAGPGPNGGGLDMVLEVSSRTGGGWRDGRQISGKALANAVNWTLQRFGEDVLWLTFPLEWGAPGVKVSPLPDVTGENGRKLPATKVSSGTGIWDVQLDPDTGRITKTVFTRRGSGSLDILWDDWKAFGGVYFALKRTIEETHEVVLVTVNHVSATPPAGTF